MAARVEGPPDPPREPGLGRSLRSPAVKTWVAGPSPAKAFIAQAASVSRLNRRLQSRGEGRAEWGNLLPPRCDASAAEILQMPRCAIDGAIRDCGSPQPRASPRCVSTGRAGFYMLSGEPSRSRFLPFDLVPSVCPHDCPSACALEVERIDGRHIGRVRGASTQSYTQGVVCAKVARYAERQHHPARLSRPLRRVGEKGVGEAAFAPISWDDALDEVAEQLTRATQRYGSETVWPYFYGGTTGAGLPDGTPPRRH